MFSIRPCQRPTSQGREQPHVAGEADQPDPGLGQGGVDRSLVRLAVAPEWVVVEGGGGDAGRGGGAQAGGVRGIGQHQRDLGRVVRVAGGLD